MTSGWFDRFIDSPDHPVHQLSSPTRKLGTPTTAEPIAASAESADLGLLPAETADPASPMQELIPSATNQPEDGATETGRVNSREYVAVESAENGILLSRYLY